MAIDLNDVYILDDTAEQVDQVIDLPNKAASLTAEQVAQFWANLGGLASAPAEGSAQPITAGAVYAALAGAAGLPVRRFNFYGDWTQTEAPATERILMNDAGMVDADDGTPAGTILGWCQNAAKNGDAILAISQYGEDGWPDPVFLYPAGDQNMLSLPMEASDPTAPTGLVVALYRLYISGNLTYLERRIDNAHKGHWQGSQAAYNALATKDPAVLYYIV